jgi:hypothetical protein
MFEVSGSVAGLRSFIAASRKARPGLFQHCLKFARAGFSPGGPFL